MITASLPRILQPLRHRDYRLFAGGMLASLFGDGVFLVALPLQVYALSNIPTAMAVVGFVWGGSQVTLLLVGGWAGDRFERRRIILVADVVRALAFGAIAILALTGAIALWHLWVLGLLVGASNAFFNPAVSAVVPDLLPPDELPQANAFLGTARPAMARLIGPAVGGLIVAGVGPGGAFAVNALTFLVSATLIAAVRHRPEPRAKDKATLGASVREVVEGFRYVRTQTWCWAWLLAQAVGVLAFSGPVDMLLPFVLLNDMGLTDQQVGPSLGLILSAGGLGSVVAAVFVGQRDLPRRFVTAMYAAEAVGVAMLLVYATMTQIWMGAVAALVLNAAFAFSDIAWVTTLQRQVPRQLLGRVSSLDWLTALGLIPLSFVIAGPLAAAYGARVVLGAGAVGGVLLLVGLLFVPGARQPEEEPLAAKASVPPSGPKPTPGQGEHTATQTSGSGSAPEN